MICGHLPPAPAPLTPLPSRPFGSGWLKGMYSLPFKASGTPFPIHSISTDQAPTGLFAFPQHWAGEGGAEAERDADRILPRARSSRREQRY